MRSPAAASRLILGNRTVTMEIEKMPKGSWKNTRAYCMAETLPSSSAVASVTATCSSAAEMIAEKSTGSQALRIFWNCGKRKWKSGRRS